MRSSVTSVMPCCCVQPAHPQQPPPPLPQTPPLPYESPRIVLSCKTARARCATSAAPHTHHCWVLACWTRPTVCKSLPDHS